MHDEIAAAVVSSGAAAACTKCDDNVQPTTLPNMNAEGKFPERGDEDIVGPMVRQATMSIIAENAERKRPSLWRRFTGPLRK
jgi:hypothetical protein